MYVCMNVCVCNACYRILWMGLTLVGSISYATSILLGQTMGRGDVKQSRLLVGVGMSLALVVAMVLGGVVAVIPRQLGNIFRFRTDSHYTHLLHPPPTLTHPPQALTHFLTHPFTHSLTHSSTPSPTHPPTSNDVSLLDKFEEIRVPLAVVTTLMNFSVALERVPVAMGRTKVVLFFGLIGSWIGQVG